MSLLNIQPDEVRMVGLMAGLFLLVQGGHAIGDNTAFALFMAKNVEKLPYMYLPLGVLVFLVSLGYTAGLGRFQNASVVLWFISGFVLLLFLEWVGVLLLQTLAIYWLTVNGLGVVLGTLLWTTAGEVCDARQAKRLFPLFASIGILGSIVGNLSYKTLARWFGPENLIVIYALLLGGAFLLLRKITRAYFKPEPPSLYVYDLASDLRSGFDYVRSSGLFRLVAVSAVLLSVSYFTVSFVFSRALAEKFAGDLVELGAYKGVLSSVIAVVSFFISLFVANRLYARLGIVNSILLMPITYFFGFILAYVFFGFNPVVLFRLTHQIVLGGVVSTAWNAMFNVVPLERRGQVLAFMNGVPAQLGVILSGLLLIVSGSLFSNKPEQILIMGAVIALICFYFAWKMRVEYGNALVSALSLGRMEVFSEEEDAFSGYSNDPDALQSVLKALHDDKPSVRRIATEVLAKMHSPVVISYLIERLSDGDAGVRLAATKALSNLNVREAVTVIQRGLDDQDDAVREQTLASLTKLEVDSSPDLIHTLERLLESANVRVTARAAVVLLYLREPARAMNVLSALLRDDDPAKRRLTLDAYYAIVSQATGAIAFDSALMIQALDDPNVAVRRQALSAASYVVDEAVIEAVARQLQNEDAGVRRAASESLKQAWPRSRSAVLQILNESEDISASYALDAIPAGDIDILNPMRNYIQREVAGIQHWRTLLEALPSKGRITKLLRATLRYRISLVEERLVQAVGLFGNPRAMDLVRKALKAGNVSVRAAALEALETLGDRRITTEVLPILDRGGVFQADGEKMATSKVAEYLITHEDRWLRAMGAYVAIEWEIDDLYVEVRKLTTLDPDNLVKDSARTALSFLGGSVRMKTLKTLSTLDRILLLRDVPMFEGLSPEDLEKIAEIAEEQLFMDQALLCREGEPGRTLFIIASGVVEVLKETDSGVQILASRITGDFVGEMAIIDSAPRSASLKARGGVRALVIEGDAFNAIMLDRPQVAVAVLRNMSTRVRELNQRLGAA